MQYAFFLNVSNQSQVHPPKVYWVSLLSFIVKTDIFLIIYIPDIPEQ